MVEPVGVRGRPSRKEFFEAGQGCRHPLLVLRWQEGDMGYSLGSNLMLTMEGL